MNYYERIQASVDFIEAHLTDTFTVQDVADTAFMSVANFYRMFLSLVGYTVKEYTRKRRLSLAADELCNNDTTEMTILDIAVKYQYNSADSFARAFKSQCGILPSEFKSKHTEQHKKALFKRICIMDSLFDCTDTASLTAYPDIKVIKELPAMKVACFSYYGDAPEEHAFNSMKQWVENQGKKLNNGYRIFGYNNPDPKNPADPNETYGYEVCVTITDTEYATLPDAPTKPDNTTYTTVMRKTLTGGRFAVVAIKRATNDTSEDSLGNAIMLGWKRFNTWLAASKYTWANRQYLEEHLGFTDNGTHIGGVELYLPIVEKQ